MTPPTRVDAFAGIADPKASDSPFKDLALGVIFSQNTKNSLEYSKKHARSTLGAFDPNEAFERVMALLRSEFKVVHNVASAQEARGAGADVAGVLDYYLEVPSTIFGHVKVDAAVALVGLDGQTLETARGTGDVKGTQGDGFTGQTRIINAMKTAQAQALEGLKAGLESSQSLKTLAAAVASGKTAPVVAAPKLRNSEVDAPKYRLDADDAKVAVVIGVEKYSSLPAAEYAERDARAVREHLRSLGYADRNVALLTGDQAGRASIEKYIESWLPARVNEKSSVFVYFSGHGAPEPTKGQAYLVPWDGDPKFLQNTGYPLSRLYEKLGTLKAKQIVVALDACFSGAGGRSVLAKGLRPLVTNIQASALPANVVVLSASAADEVTGTDEKQGHGLFTYFLLKGLNDNAGTPTVKALYDFVSPKVQDAARLDNRDQTPQLSSAEHAGLRL